VTSFGSNYYFHYDGLGSVVGVMDANGSVGKTYSYDPFGNTTESGSSPVNSNLRFAGGYHEPAPHNLYQFGTRSYDPTIGRWTQQDSSGLLRGAAEGEPCGRYRGRALRRRAFRRWRVGFFCSTYRRARFCHPHSDFWGDPLELACGGSAAALLGRAAAGAEIGPGEGAVLVGCFILIHTRGDQGHG
jgi:RHS repeat-associated protein